MTRLSPSPEEGPVTQPHISGTPNTIVSELYHMYIVSYQLGSGPVLHTVFYQQVQCVPWRKGQILVTGECP